MSHHAREELLAEGDLRRVDGCRMAQGLSAECLESRSARHALTQVFDRGQLSFKTFVPLYERLRSVGVLQEMLIDVVHDRFDQGRD